MMANGEDTLPLSDEEIGTLLAKQRRRYLLYCLCQYTNPVSLAAVADCVTEWELHVPAEEQPEERLRIYMSLYHDHLPPIEEAGVITYCQTEDMVALTVAADQLEPYLRRTAEHDLPPSDREW